MERRVGYCLRFVRPRDVPAVSAGPAPARSVGPDRAATHGLGADGGFLLVLSPRGGWQLYDGDDLVIGTSCRGVGDVDVAQAWAATQLRDNHRARLVDWRAATCRHGRLAFAAVMTG
jgi:hypothetical protein